MMRIVISVFTLCCGLSATVTTDPQSELPSIKAEADSLREAYGSLQPSSNITVIGKRLTQTDARIRSYIVAMLQQEHDLTAIIKASQGTLRWREWPKNPTDVTRLRFLTETDRDKASVLVNYRRWAGPNNEVHYLIQHSFWNREKAWRISPSMYTITVREGRTELRVLPDPGDQPADLRGDASPPYFIGFVGGGDTPTLVLLDGPHGSGAFADVYCYGWHVQSRSWVQHSVLRRDSWSEFRYEESTATLGYAVPTDQGIKWRTFVFANEASPVRIELERGTGTGKVPLAVSIVNTTDASVKIKLVKPQDCVFRSGMLRLSLWDMHGMGVPVQLLNGGAALECQDAIVDIPPHQRWKYQFDWASVVTGVSPGDYLLSLQYSNSDGDDVFCGFMLSSSVEFPVAPKGKK